MSATPLKTIGADSQKVSFTAMVLDGIGAVTGRKYIAKKGLNEISE